MYHEGNNIMEAEEQYVILSPLWTTLQRIREVLRLWGLQPGRYQQIFDPTLCPIWGRKPEGDIFPPQLWSLLWSNISNQYKAGQTLRLFRDKMCLRTGCQHTEPEFKCFFF